MLSALGSFLFSLFRLLLEILLKFQSIELYTTRYIHRPIDFIAQSGPNTAACTTGRHSSEYNSSLNLLDTGNRSLVSPVPMENILDSGEDDNSAENQNGPVHVHQVDVFRRREEGENDSERQIRKGEAINGQTKASQGESSPGETTGPEPSADEAAD